MTWTDQTVPGAVWTPESDIIDVNLNYDVIFAYDADFLVYDGDSIESEVDWDDSTVPGAIWVDSD